MQKRIAVYPGTFNPFTIGHDSIVKRTLALCDEVVIAVGENPAKKDFDSEAIAQNICSIYRDEPRVKVTTYSGATALLAKDFGADCMVRGVRNAIDFEYERQLAETNLKVFGIETILLPALPELAFVSSSMVRELQSLGQDVTRFLP